MRPTLVLDLDGTLVDTLPDLGGSINRLLAAHALPPLEPDEIRAMIGDGAKALVDRALRARGREPDPADLVAFLDDYGAHATERSRPFPGVVDALAAARAEGWGLAVCTNKPVAPARLLLDAVGLLPMLDAIGGGDSFPSRKPDPAHLLATIEAAGGDPARAVMVGDHRNDVAAAAGADVPVIFARWGYGTPAMAAGASAEADGFSEVPALAASLLSGRSDTSSRPRTTASGS